MISLVVLPGLDGTATLHSAFADAVAPAFDSVAVIAYPPDQALDYAALEALVRPALPATAPFVLLGESFSGPIALAIAANPPCNLMGLVLSTTFVASPAPLFAPLASLTRVAPVRSLPLPLLSWWLLGRWATPKLETSLQNALLAVSPAVLRFRATIALRARGIGRLWLDCRARAQPPRQRRQVAFPWFRQADRRGHPALHDRGHRGTSSVAPGRATSLRPCGRRVRGSPQGSPILLGAENCQALQSMKPDEPLQYPPHYPPTDRWKRFFIGVRWLGPDLSFFRQLSAQQKARTRDLLDQWGGGVRQQIAAEVGAIFARHLRWPGVCFLPGDKVTVIAGGPRFTSIDGDLDAEEAVGEIEECLGVTLPRSFWQGAGASTLGELVDQLLAAGAAPGRRLDSDPPLDPV